VPNLALAPVIRPRPVHVPAQTANIIGHRRRNTIRSVRPASICQTLVTNDGKSRIPAASTGGASRSPEVP